MCIYFINVIDYTIINYNNYGNNIKKIIVILLYVYIYSISCKNVGQK